ncbi:MAG: Pseudouridine-5'-phosphate glycosidase [Thermotoga sp. 50_1627]|uniref:pseudouridine-5'-phosphate glycosidase n=1 Tax=Pseudothermotoga sp. TaxID=2033661 RepID=UPI00076CBE75|nr:MAG: Pseudouridine-5'-phosphate glycosidase [Thermotoga sp. 50_64]KUK25708.1 MAG: Pseudouridine-5'-phosphate glycosidase [Thermotoga sp. 50_1627]MBC7115621.1 pseudouridine-5'-phosphate glycosidase [Pseudothermotoga sp.]HBT39961.1 pseudouridine-5-phosphate glycosidase [Pseudothermotoga sp.]HCO98496.1 pseudouridine-5-phosphate glycosidase [Pseudothermotoga sp.]
MIKAVALESTVIAHGLPRPLNVQVAQQLENLARQKGCEPKTIAIIEGQIKAGVTLEELVQLGMRDDVMKIGVAEIPVAVAKKAWAATTVSATIRIASKHGVEVFATGGIGGVHDIEEWDVSQDLVELSRTRMIVVCAGPKSLLDLKATVEMLETLQVTVLGYRTDRLPAFYVREVDIPVLRVDDVSEIAAIYFAKCRLDLPGSVLVLNPVPAEYEISAEQLFEWDRIAKEELRKAKIEGKAVTPFLLAKLAEISNGKTVRSNVELLKNNVSLACDIANELVRYKESF